MKNRLEVRERGVQSLGFSRGHQINLTIENPRTHPLDPYTIINHLDRKCCVSPPDILQQSNNTTLHQVKG